MSCIELTDRHRAVLAALADPGFGRAGQGLVVGSFGMSESRGTRPTGLRKLLAVVVFLVGLLLTLLWVLFVLVSVFDSDVRRPSAALTLGVIAVFTALLGVPGGLAVRWGVRQLRSGAEAARRRSGRSEYGRRVGDLARYSRSAVPSSRRREWTRVHSQMVGGAFFVLLLLALSAFLTLVVLPTELRYHLNSETVSGTMIRMVRTVCDEAACYGNAEVHFQTTDGQSITEVFAVDLDASSGDSIPVTYLRDDPLEARHFGPSFPNTLVAVMGGPVLALGIGGYLTWFVRKQRARDKGDRSGGVESR